MQRLNAPRFALNIKLTEQNIFSVRKRESRQKEKQYQ